MRGLWQGSRCFNTSVWDGKKGSCCFAMSKCGMIASDPGLSEEGLNYFYHNYSQGRFDNEDKMLKRLIKYDQDLEFFRSAVLRKKRVKSN